MATGDRAFRRGSVPETLAAIIRDEPDPIADLRTDAPRPLVWIIERCLEKDSEERYASPRDLARDLTRLSAHLSEAGSGPERATSVPVPRRRRREAVAWTAAAVFAVLAAALALLWRQKPTGSGRRIQASVLPDVSAPGDVMPPGSLDLLALNSRPTGHGSSFSLRAPAGIGPSGCSLSAAGRC
jgi:hypothetical protein